MRYAACAFLWAVAVGFAACSSRVEEPPPYERISPDDLKFGISPPPLAGAGKPIETFRKGKIVLPGGKTLTVELARSAQEVQQGLMFRESLPEDSGMLFFFRQHRYLSFWMKNTLIDLDMIFISQDKKITSIEANVPRSHKDTPADQVATRQGIGRYVLELPAGAAKRYGLKKGDLLQFDD